MEMVTDEDGDVKGVYYWLGSGSSGGGGGGNTEVHVGATEEPAARQLRRRDGVQRGSVVAVAMEVAAAPPPGSPQRRVGGTHPRASAPAEASPQGNRQRRRLEKGAERGASGDTGAWRGERWPGPQHANFAVDLHRHHGLRNFYFRRLSLPVPEETRVLCWPCLPDKMGS